MQNTSPTLLIRHYLFTALILFGFIIPIYSNTFHASWHLDDYANIVHNPRIHMTRLNMTSLQNATHARIDGGAYKGDRMYRPIPGFTFALNWYWGKDDVTGYHAVNILLHFLTAWFLFLLAYRLLCLPRLNGRFADNAYTIALVAAVLWAIHPIQTQAVTYIVQRMAVMAALFYSIGLYVYVNGRFKPKVQRWFYFTGTGVCYVLALGCKENAVLFPAAILLLEICFVQEPQALLKKKKVLGGVIALLFGMVIAAYVLTDGHLLSFVTGYKSRGFTLQERLFTQPRVLLFYLSQLILPLSERFSIDHDILLSTSLLTPWTTLPSIIVVGVTPVICILQINKRPLISFGILFFFLNHLVESTVYPLEIIFEHRNYLPSLFLFLTFSAYFKEMIDTYRHKAQKRLMYALMVVSTCFLCMWLGGNTYIRNADWQSEKTLWRDAIVKAPGLARPVHNLAMMHFERRGDYQTALQLYRVALGLKDVNQTNWQAVVLNNIAGIYSAQQNVENAITFYRLSLEKNPQFNIARYNLSSLLIRQRQLDIASLQADMLLAAQPNNAEYLNLKGYIAMEEGHFAGALNWFRRGLKRVPTHRNILLNIGKSLTMMGSYPQARMVYTWCRHLFPSDILPYVYLAENAIMDHDDRSSGYWLDTLIIGFDLKDILTLGATSDISDAALYPFSKEVVLPALKKAIGSRCDRINALHNRQSDGAV